MNGNTMLLRQIHPSFVQAGFATSQAFRPTPKDESKLSVYDGDLISPEKAWHHYTGALELTSVGIMGLTRDECHAEELKVDSDPVPFPEHAVVDFSGLSDSQCRAKSKRLQAKARERDWLYTPRR